MISKVIFGSSFTALFQPFVPFVVLFVPFVPFVQFVQFSTAPQRSKDAG
jgi:hypothetical protein